MKSTNFYYPAKIFELLSANVMIMIRTPPLSPDRRAARVAGLVRMGAPQ
ncbi:hypothetical protein [Mesorhizobium sp. BR1-1-14]|nr:hypothetical protein [Mesorhizobium sp. BR1-1-14]MBZ9958778.1 hypothetical protein [Mesorhizobium sp. BR1-1-14]